MKWTKLYKTTMISCVRLKLMCYQLSQQHSLDQSSKTEWTHLTWGLMSSDALYNDFSAVLLCKIYIFDQFNDTGLNDLSTPLGICSTWHWRHFFWVDSTLDLHKNESGINTVELTPRGVDAKGTKMCIRFELKIATIMSILLCHKSNSCGLNPI